MDNVLPPAPCAMRSLASTQSCISSRIVLGFSRSRSPTSIQMRSGLRALLWNQAAHEIPTRRAASRVPRPLLIHVRAGVSRARGDTTPGGTTPSPARRSRRNSRPSLRDRSDRASTSHCAWLSASGQHLVLHKFGVLARHRVVLQSRARCPARHRRRCRSRRPPSAAVCVRQSDASSAANSRRSGPSAPTINGISVPGT